jgi:hypothetical protein
VEVIVAPRESTWYRRVASSSATRDAVEIDASFGRTEILAHAHVFAMQSSANEIASLQQQFKDNQVMQRGRRDSNRKLLGSYKVTKAQSEAEQPNPSLPGHLRQDRDVQGPNSNAADVRTCLDPKPTTKLGKMNNALIDEPSNKRVC